MADVAIVEPRASHDALNGMAYDNRREFESAAYSNWDLLASYLELLTAMSCKKQHIWLRGKNENSFLEVHDDILTTDTLDAHLASFEQDNCEDCFKNDNGQVVVNNIATLAGTYRDRKKQDMTKYIENIK